MHGDHIPADAALHPAHGVRNAAVQFAARSACGDSRRVRIQPVRLFTQPPDYKGYIQTAGCAHVQGQRCGGLAFAAESGHISHAQLRLRSFAKALADVSYIRNAHRPVLFPFPSGGAELQL